MMIIPESELRNVTEVSRDKMELIKAYIQGAVYCWVKNRKDEQFAARDLFGGENFEWEGTPLYILFEKHYNSGKSVDDSIKYAGRDLGWILKRVLAEDKRSFNVGRSGLSAGYVWIGNED